MVSFRQSRFLYSFICFSLIATARCFAQTEIDASVGILKNFTDLQHVPLRGNSGELTANQGSGDPAFGVHVTFPLIEDLKLQTGLRLLHKTYTYQLHFKYQNKFAFENRWVNWGNSLELPVHVVYTIPRPIKKREIRVSAGFSLGHNRIYELSDSRATEIYVAAPNTLVHTFNTELFIRERLITPALEAGFEIKPLLLKAVGLRGTLHYDLLPAFGSVTYLNHYYFDASGKTVQGYPEGTLRAEDTGYIMLELYYKLPFWPKKKKAA